jgi:50S ribosomal protein L16 3-hydroxylase
LNRRTKMMFDTHHIFINGESFTATGKDALTMRQLANERELNVKQVQKISAQARELVLSWVQAGWLHAV